MVRLVSAMLVASTILRCPRGAGASAASCAAAVSSPYSGRTRTLRVGPASSSARCTRPNFRRAGQEAQDVAVVLARARAHHLRGLQLERDLGAARHVMGRDLEAARRARRRWARRRAAARAAAGPASPTSPGGADPRAGSAGSRCTAPSPRSAFRLRSWNSSKITQPMPASAESSCSMRVRMPSVTTSMRVSRLTRVSSRVRNPTVGRRVRRGAAPCGWRRRAPRCGAARASGFFAPRATGCPARRAARWCSCRRLAEPPAARRGAGQRFCQRRQGLVDRK